MKNKSIYFIFFWAGMATP